MREIIDENIFLHLEYLKEINHRESSIVSRRQHLNRWKAWLRENNVREVDREVVKSYLNRHEVSPNYRAAEINHLSQFYSWAVFEGKVEKDPTLRIKRPLRRRGLPRPMPMEDVEVALKMATGNVRAWLYIAAYTGLRACEIAQLRSEDIDWDRNLLFIREQKGGSSGSVPIAPLLIPILKDVYKTGWLFPKGQNYANYKYEGHVTANKLQQKCNKYLHSLGIESTFHSLRHWYGTNCYKACKDIRLTQEAMRHNSVESTAIYTRIDDDAIADMVASLPSFDKGCAA